MCSLCLQDKGNRLHVLTTSNREINLSPKRAVLISGPTIDTLSPRDSLLERLKQTEETRKRLKSRVDVKELWELIKDEKESFDHEYLAQLVFGETSTDDHFSALVRALFEDRLYFKMKDGRLAPNSEERVDQIVRQREEEALKEERLKQGSLWLRDLRQGKKPHDYPCKEDIVNMLIQLALYRNEVPDFKYGKEMLARAGISDMGETRNLLIRLGVWEEDENLDLLRSGIEISFTKKQMDESELLAESEIGLEGREDLRGLPTLTIDGPLTRDYDDALSLEEVGEILRVGIHIADVAAFISPDSVLDRMAAERGSSLYLARRQIPMIPPHLSQDTLSLKQGCDRLSISLLANLDKKGKVLDYQFVPSVIRVQRQLTYDEVNDTIEEEGMLRKMYLMSQRLRQTRMNQGALSLSLPELEVKCNADSSVSLKSIDQNTPSRVIVAEFMILYNWLAAKFCRENHVPILFRTQSEPSEILSEEGGYLYYVFKQRRKLSPLQIDTAPKPHSGLGLDVYTHATSPIRRYLDLVVQRQIRQFFIGTGPACDEKKLEEIRISVEPVIKNLEMLKRNRLRYWTLKFLSQHLGETYKALVLDELKNKYRIVLADFLFVAEIKRQNGIMLNPGQEILVEVKKVDPWTDLLDLTYVRD